MIKKDSPHCTALREFLFRVSMSQELIEGVFLKKVSLRPLQWGWRLSFSSFRIWKIYAQLLLSRYEPTHVVQSLSQSNCLWPHGLQHARLPCPSPTPGAYSNSCPSSWCCHPTISPVVPFSSSLQSSTASVSFPMSQFFASGGQSIGASASVLPTYIQDWFPLELTGLISLQSKGLSGVFSNTTVQKHQFFSAQLSLWSNSHIHTWLLEKL